MPPSLDQVSVWDALKDELAILLRDGTGIYRNGKVPGADGQPEDPDTGGLPVEFVKLHLERRYLPASHGSRLRSRSGWRVIARFVSDTGRNADALATEASALEGKRLTIGGRTSGPIEFEVAEAVGPDDGKFSGSTTWTVTF